MMLSVVAAAIAAAAAAPLTPGVPAAGGVADRLAAVEALWYEEAMPSLLEYLRIPNQSPAYDPEWETNGLMMEALVEVKSWAEALGVEGLTLDVMVEPGKPPLLYGEIEARNSSQSKSVLLYSHLDKQPPLTEEWSEGKGPYDPVIEDGKLYARGAVDDGYAFYSYLVAVKVMQQEGISHPRFVLLAECEEESGSPNLEYYLNELLPFIGMDVGIVVVLDSGAGDYERMYLTVSLRGIVSGSLSVNVLDEGLHSGSFGGIVASSFRRLRTVMDHIEDSETGAVLIPEFHTEIPRERLEQAAEYASVVGEGVYNEIPFAAGAGPVTEDVEELVINKSWRPSMAVVGAAGLPDAATAGNVLRPYTLAKLSFRIPPLVDSAAAAAALEATVAANQVGDARIEMEVDQFDDGWNAGEFPAAFVGAVEAASRTYYGNEVLYAGEGGSIPFIKLLSETFEGATMLISGAVGPGANAHGPDEFLELDYTVRLTASVLDILASSSE